jgi:hypothetical protein
MVIDRVTVNSKEERIELVGVERKFRQLQRPRRLHPTSNSFLSARAAPAAPPSAADHRRAHVVLLPAGDRARERMRRAGAALAMIDRIVSSSARIQAAGRNLRTSP